MSKAQLTKGNVKAVDMYTADIGNGIRELEPILRDVFESLRQGEVGEHVRSISIKLFNEWLSRSLLPDLDRSTNSLSTLLLNIVRLKSSRKS